MLLYVIDHNNNNKAVTVRRKETNDNTEAFHTQPPTIWLETRYRILYSSHYGKLQCHLTHKQTIWLDTKYRMHIFIPLQEITVSSHTWNKQPKKHPYTHTPTHHDTHTDMRAQPRWHMHNTGIPVGVSVDSSIPHCDYPPPPPPLPQRRRQPFLITMSQASNLLSDSFMSESPFAQQGTVVCPWNLAAG